MSMGKKKGDGEEKSESEISIWLGPAQQNMKDAVEAFSEQWISMPDFDIGVEVMDLRQLRDAMGIRATPDYGDPWPSVEQMLLRKGFRWHQMGGKRVMYLKEREGFVPDTGWDDGEPLDD